MSLEDIKKKEKSFIKKHATSLIRVLGLGVVLALGGLFVVNSNVDSLPSSTSDFAATSVMITGIDMRSGGTGVVLSSSNTESIVLTNKHVCRLIEEGGFVVRDNKNYLIKEYNKYKHHDLCAVRIAKNLKINTQVADIEADKYSRAYISGHPSLLPHVLTQADYSGHQIIRLITAIRKCNDEDYQRRDLIEHFCALFGVAPVIEEYESQLVTGTILPGSSGSGVFNSEGQLTNLVFAGNGRGFSYAFTVPFEYVADFVQNLHSPTETLHSPWTKTGKKIKDEDIVARIMSPLAFKNDNMLLGDIDFLELLETLSTESKNNDKMSTKIVVGNSIIE